MLLLSSFALAERSDKVRGNVVIVVVIIVVVVVERAGDKSAEAKANDLFVFAAAKAGMKEVDKAKIANVIYESSKNSEYFKRQKRQDEVNEKKVKALKESFRLFGEIKVV